jgi:hypothetical protein
MILAYGVMDALRIDRVKYLDTSGTTTGMLLTEKYWVEQTVIPKDSKK